MNRIKKAAIALAAGGTALGLMSMGVGAAFTDGATATQSLKVGSFGCAISSTTTGALVSTDQRSITYNASDIMSSAPGSSPLAFTVTSTGTIPVNVAIVQTAPIPSPFTSVLVSPVADRTLANNAASTTYAAGLQWPELQNGDLNKVVSITYRATCTEKANTPPAPTQIPLTLTGSSRSLGTYTSAAAPVVDNAARTITWTIPVDAAATPSYHVFNWDAGYPNPIVGAFIATPSAPATVTITASATVSSSLSTESNKFQLGYVFPSPMTGWTAFSPAKMLNTPAFNLTTDAGWSSTHNSDNNGLGVEWAGVVGTGTVTIVLTFSAV